MMPLLVYTYTKLVTPNSTGGEVNVEPPQMGGGRIVPPRMGFI